jgi:hypothetical protein
MAAKPTKAAIKQGLPMLERTDGSSSKEPCCGNCVFWYNTTWVEGLGACRRYPPSISHPTLVGEITCVGPTAKVVGPATRVGDWCGEHKKK